MPGEDAGDALRAAEELAAQGIGSLYTRLGENVSSLTAAENEVSHYVAMMDAVAARAFTSWPSIKLTHLGLDIDVAACERNLLHLAEHAAARDTMLWIDMEDSSYVDVTLRLFEAARAAHRHVGLCLQAYLRRTPQDLERLLPLAPAVRLVKGAYLEPPDVAYPRKREVDDRYLDLGERLLGAAGSGSAFPVFGTHDTALISRLRQSARQMGVLPSRYEFHLLYGIGVKTQRELTQEGETIRVLISYGRDWFPWYMRRLAERPANVWFAARHLLG